MAQNPYTPTDFEPLVMEKFAGINTFTTRPGVPDEQMAWCDGFMPVAERQLRTLWGLGPALWTVPNVGQPGHAVIVKFYGATQRFLAVLSDGSAWDVPFSTTPGSPTLAAPVGTLVSPSGGSPTDATCDIIRLPGQGVLIIVSSQTNGYFVYTGGGQLYTPGQTIPGVGVVPTGVSATTIASYQGRIWLGNNNVIAFSAPGSALDFSTGNGGGAIISNDDTLRTAYTRLIQSNGFLYAVGDSNLSYISGVQTSGTPPVTTFTFQNADPMIGSSWPSAVLTWGHDVMISNVIGVHRASGATVNKVSYELDGVYGTGTLGSFLPSSAKADIFGRRVFLLLLPIIDPISNAPGNKVIMWDGKRWWTCPTAVSLSFIASVETNSQLTAYGTDGNSIYPMFASPSTLFAKRVRSKYWDKPGSYTHNKAVDRFWSLWQYNSVSSPNVTLSVDAVAVDRSSGATVENANTYTITGPASTGYFTSPPQAVAQQGILIGMTFTTACADVTLISAALGPNIQEYRG